MSEITHLWKEVFFRSSLNENIKITTKHEWNYLIMDSIHIVCIHHSVYYIHSKIASKNLQLTTKRTLSSQFWVSRFLYLLALFLKSLTVYTIAKAHNKLVFPFYKWQLIIKCMFTSQISRKISKLAGIINWWEIIEFCLTININYVCQIDKILERLMVDCSATATNFKSLKVIFSFGAWNWIFEQSKYLIKYENWTMKVGKWLMCKILECPKMFAIKHTEVDALINTFPLLIGFHLAKRLLFVRSMIIRLHSI